MNITALNSISNFELNTTIINNTENIAQNIVNNTNDVSGGYYGLAVLLVLYIFLVILLYMDADVFRLDIVKSSVLASSICTILGIFGLALDIFTNFRHVMLFAIILIFSLIASYYMKEKGI